jgi:azurin
MKYTPDRLKIRVGDKVRFTFQNTDMMEHNVVILKPGTMDKVGALADQMAATPDGAARDYVPISSDVLWSAPVLDPGKFHEILFDAPTTPGQYPFICTFPGHWRIMQGILIVEPAG